MSKLTKNGGGVELVYRESFDNICSAAKREKEVKGWRRDKKEKLIANFKEKSDKIACSEERSDEERP